MLLSGAYGDSFETGKSFPGLALTGSLKLTLMDYEFSASFPVSPTSFAKSCELLYGLSRSKQ
jgi:hypothetical protein